MVLPLLRHCLLQVRDCRLFGLVGLALHLDTVAQKVRAYFDDLLGIGVAGWSQ